MITDLMFMWGYLFGVLLFLGTLLCLPPFLLFVYRKHILNVVYSIFKFPLVELKKIDFKKLIWGYLTFCFAFYLFLSLILSILGVVLVWWVL
jgi:hypothetical protein